MFIVKITYPSDNSDIIGLGKKAGDRLFRHSFNINLNRSLNGRDGNHDSRECWRFDSLTSIGDKVSQYDSTCYIWEKCENTIFLSNLVCTRAREMYVIWRVSPRKIASASLGKSFRSFFSYIYIQFSSRSVVCGSGVYWLLHLSSSEVHASHSQLFLPRRFEHISDNDVVEQLKCRASTCSAIIYFSSYISATSPFTYQIGLHLKIKAETCDAFCRICNKSIMRNIIRLINYKYNWRNLFISYLW